MLHLNKLAHLDSDSVDNYFSLPAHVYLKNKSGIYLECNIVQAKSYGGTKESDILGSRDIDYFDEQDSYVLKVNDRKIVSSETVQVFIEKTKFPACPIHTVVSYKAPVRNKLGKVVGVMGISFLLDQGTLAAVQRGRFNAVDFIDKRPA